jgi:hypothetical protein
MNMMQGNMAMMVPQMAMMGIVNYFFSGFVLGKIPFPLTPSFKGMLQRGISLTTLDTSYVTSMSWYFLVMFGMRGLYSITMAGAVMDDTAMMQAQMGMGAQQPGQVSTTPPFPFAKLVEAKLRRLQHQTLHLHRLGDKCDQVRVVPIIVRLGVHLELGLAERPSTGWARDSAELRGRGLPKLRLSPV